MGWGPGRVPQGFHFLLLPGSLTPLLSQLLESSFRWDQGAPQHKLCKRGDAGDTSQCLLDGQGPITGHHRCATRHTGPRGSFPRAPAAAGPRGQVGESGEESACEEPLKSGSYLGFALPRCWVYMHTGMHRLGYRAASQLSIPH